MSPDNNLEIKPVTTKEKEEEKRRERIHFAHASAQEVSKWSPERRYQSFSQLHPGELTDTGENHEPVIHTTEALENKLFLAETEIQKLLAIIEEYKKVWWMAERWSEHGNPISVETWQTFQAAKTEIERLEKKCG